MRMQARQQTSTASLRRVYAACYAEKPNEDFLKRQRIKKGVGAKCKTCAAQVNQADGPSTAADMETDYYGTDGCARALHLRCTS